MIVKRSQNAMPIRKKRRQNFLKMEKDVDKIRMQRDQLCRRVLWSRRLVAQNVFWGG